MIIVYEVVESTEEKNTYKAFPISVHRCCQESILWFFRYPMDCIVKEKVLLVRSVNNLADRFNHCQFCGAKHEFYTKEEEADLRIANKIISKK